jgi:hypothetical protein
MNATAFAQRVTGARRSGAGYVCRCPAHDDERASLSFADGVRGVVIKCHAGCSAEAVMRALDLPVSMLFNAAPSPAEIPRVVAEYQYRDEGGELLYVVERREPKDFRQRRPDGRGGWTWSLSGVRRVLYRLPEIIAQKVAYVLEGEQDADRVAGLGLPATTSPGGAGKWRDEYAEQLRASGVESVAVFPDNDPPGEAHALAVARSCLAAGLAVRIVRLPRLPPKGDVSDYLSAGYGKEELLAMVKAAPPVDVQTLRQPGGANAGGGFTFTPLGELLAEPEEEHAWLVDGRLPSGGLSLLAGKPKAGKSTAARCLALAVARGEPWLGFSTTQGEVLYLALEEKRAEVRRHFAAMGAGDNDPVLVFCSSSPADGLALLRAEAERRRPALIIVDPLFRLVRVPDGNDYATMSAALEPLLTLARETGAHVLAVHHLGKGERGGGDAILGSTAIFAAVDTAVMLKRSDRYRTLSTIQRYGDDLEEITLTLDAATRSLSAGPSRAEADEVETSRAILAYLTEQPEPRDEETILSAVEGKTGTKRHALRALVGTARVARTGAGKRGDPYSYSVSRFSFPHTSGNEKTRIGNGGLSAREDDTYSRSRENGSAHALSESRERESEPVEEMDL